jgi:hypothetical protein
VVPYQASGICGAILGKARVFLHFRPVFFLWEAFPSNMIADFAILITATCHDFCYLSITFLVQIRVEILVHVSRTFFEINLLS